MSLQNPLITQSYIKRNKNNEIKMIQKKNKEYDSKCNTLKNRIRVLKKEEQIYKKQLKNIKKREKQDKVIQDNKIKIKLELEKLKYEKDKELEEKRERIQRFKIKEKKGLEEKKNENLSLKKRKYQSAMNDKYLMKCIIEQLNAQQNNRNCYRHAKVKQEFNEFETNKMKQNIIKENQQKIQNENNLKDLIKETNNDNKIRSNSKKEGSSKRMSLKSYIKKVKNMYILKKKSNEKKFEIKNENYKFNLNNLSFGEEEIKTKNNPKEDNNSNSLNNINKININEQESKEDITMNNSKINNISIENKNNNDSLNKDLNIKNYDINNVTPRNRQKSVHNKSARKRSLHIKKNYNFSINNKSKNLSSEKKRYRRISVKNVDNLTKREKSYYILSKSPMLRLTERFFFGRATPNLRIVQPISSILNRNELILKDKVKELEEKLIECNKKIKTPFTASKTAEIAFNFILKKDEDDFRAYILYTDNEEEKKEYYTYIKILYVLFEESFENIELKDLFDKLI